MFSNDDLLIMELTAITKVSNSKDK